MRITIAATLMGLFVFMASAGIPVTNQGPTMEQVIVVFDDGVADPAASATELARAYGGQVGFVYRYALKGFSATLPARAVTALAQNPQVAYVETDDPVSIDVQTLPTGIERIFADDNANITIDGTDDFRVEVDVAIIDTGVDFGHPDLNVVGGVTCSQSGGGPPWARSYTCDPGGDDDNGHGTHVAGTIGALDNDFGVVGVAPGARIWAVKVLNSNGSGTEAQVVAGIDWVAANADTIEVANMSLTGAGFSQAEYDAIQGAINAGVAFAVAAGNDDDDANNYSPAAFDNVLTVSALADFDGAPGGSGSPTCRTDQDDTLADFSNWGAAVQIAAPGVCILSTWMGGGYSTISGTSMASPHAAGALALLASSNNPNNATDVSNLYGQVINAGNFNWTDDSGDGIQEPLLDVSDTNVFAPATVPGSGGGTPTDNPPTVTITNPADGSTFATGASITFTGSGSDTEDGDLTANLVWTSDIDGQIGNGGSFTTVLSDGPHLVTASVTDSGGNSSSDSITVTVGTVDEPPSVSITSPADGASFNSGEFISFTGSASDNEDDDAGLTANLVWTSSLDGPIGSGGSFSAVLNDGSHTITASVTDSGGNSSSDSITVTVGGGEVTLSGSSINNGRTWTAEVTVSGSPGDSTSGTWDYDGSSGECEILSGTSCTFDLSGIPKRVGSVTYTDSTNPSLTITILK